MGCGASKVAAPEAPAPKAPPPKASPTSTLVAPPPKAAEVIPAKALAVAPSVEEPIPAPQAAAPPVEEAIASPEPAAPPALEEPVAPPAPEEAAPPAEEASELPAPDKAPPAPEEAAIKIQAAFRGRIARKSLKTLRSEENAAVLHSRPGTGGSISMDESNALGMIELAEIEAAATKIQAIQKGRMARQEVALMKAAAIRKAEAAAGAGADLDMGTAKEKKLAQMKRDALRTWEPEYCPESIVPPSESVDTITRRSTKVSLPLILADQVTMRKTKILCTMGPKCWSEETFGKLLDAGLNVARFNFSHGDHQAQQEVLDRVRSVMVAKGSHAAVLLDTKGPEIRTAMLKDHAPIELEAGQDIIVFAAGAEYTTWEGYKTETETKIGLSYEKLCQSVQPGNRILIADGTIVIEVLEILSDTELKGKVLNSKKLGERKNCNLPGVKVDIPVLTEQDIDDVQNFCCKNKMDYIAASFVQSAADVQFIRKILDEAGGQDVQIISKIENEAGLENFDEILKYTDGVMVARGDLGMEIPSEKVALAQKMLVTKCNIAGKFCICATQMLESMIDNPLPTRAEMTDVANAVFDGCDAVMLSGETANGSFPEKAVETMAAITRDAEIANNSYAFSSFVRDFSQKPLSAQENIGHVVASTVLDCKPEIVVCISDRGLTANMLAKYHPRVPVLVVTTVPHTARQTNTVFSLYPCLVDDLTKDIDSHLQYAKTLGLYNGGTALVVSGMEEADSDENPCVYYHRRPE